MSYTVVLQDWVTVRGAANVVALMPVDQYLDMAAFQDIAAYVEISDFSGTGVGLAVQSAPVKEEAYFQTHLTFSPAGTGVQTVQISRWASASPPLARWLRWRATTSVAWSLTFRAYLNCNPVGALL